MNININRGIVMNFRVDSGNGLASDDNDLLPEPI